MKRAIGYFEDAHDPKKWLKKIWASHLWLIINISCHLSTYTYVYDYVIIKLYTKNLESLKIISKIHRKLKNSETKRWLYTKESNFFLNLLSSSSWNLLKWPALGLRLLEYIHKKKLAWNIWGHGPEHDDTIYSSIILYLLKKM